MCGELEHLIYINSGIVVISVWGRVITGLCYYLNFGFTDCTKNVIINTNYHSGMSPYIPEQGGFIGKESAGE